jgi:Flp pilus assembly protein TadD
VLLPALLAAALGAGCTLQPKTADSDATAKLVQLAQAAGDPRDAMALLAAAAAREPDNAAAQLHYASALADAGRNKEALAIAQPAFDSHKDDTRLGLLTGRLQLRLQQGAAAAVTYQTVLAHAPDNLEALNGSGIARVMQGEPSAAEPSFRRALAVAPGDTGSRNNLALSLALQGRTQEAIPMLQALLRENENSRRIRSNLALAYAIAGKRGEAQALLQPVMSGAEAETFLAAYSPLEKPRAGRTAVQVPPAEPLQLVQPVDGGSQGAK